MIQTMTLATATTATAATTAAAANKHIENKSCTAITNYFKVEYYFNILNIHNLPTIHSIHGVHINSKCVQCGNQREIHALTNTTNLLNVIVMIEIFSLLLFINFFFGWLVRFCICLSVLNTEITTE